MALPGVAWEARVLKRRPPLGTHPLLRAVGAEGLSGSGHGLPSLGVAVLSCLLFRYRNVSSRSVAVDTRRPSPPVLLWLEISQADLAILKQNSLTQFQIQTKE